MRDEGGRRGVEQRNLLGLFQGQRENIVSPWSKFFNESMIPGVGIPRLLMGARYVSIDHGKSN